MFVDGIFELCRAATSKGLRIIVVTNQGGIAKGLYTLEDFVNLTNWMNRRFLENGVKVTKVYHSPYHPDGVRVGLSTDHVTRKPNPGTIQLAEIEFELDLENSILIGDKITDVTAGQRAGVGTNLLLGNTEEQISEGAHAITRLRSALKFI